jgi:RNA polymerase sigma-70 factor (ECF subfamily)
MCSRPATVEPIAVCASLAQTKRLNVSAANNLRRERLLNCVYSRGVAAVNDNVKDYRRLLQSAREGSSEEVGQLLDAYRAYLGLLARLHINRQLRGKADPSDLVQETFLAAHKNFPQFRGTTEEELLAWLRQIMASKLANLARRYVISTGRAVHLERQMSDDLDRSSSAMGGIFEDGGSSPSGRAARREQAVLLANALEQLPDDYREVIVLRHLEELNFPEIAVRMNRTLDSVKNLWTRALARLKQSLVES